MTTPIKRGARVAQWVRSLDLTAHTSLSPIRGGFAPSFVNYKKGALDSQLQVIKLTSCLPMVDGSPRVLRLLPPLKLVAMILLKMALNTKNQILLREGLLSTSVGWSLVNLQIPVTWISININERTVQNQNNFFVLILDWVFFGGVFMDRNSIDCANT